VDNPCTCIGCAGHRSAKQTGYVRVVWYELAPGERTGGAQVQRETRYHDADFGRPKALELAQESAARVLRSGKYTSAPTVHG
jgi:hypothetical protein